MEVEEEKVKQIFIVCIAPSHIWRCYARTSCAWRECLFPRTTCGPLGGRMRRASCESEKWEGRGRDGLIMKRLV